VSSLAPRDVDERSSFARTLRLAMYVAEQPKDNDKNYYSGNYAAA
jgi:hypothetical protein